PSPTTPAFARVTLQNDRSRKTGPRPGPPRRALRSRGARRLAGRRVRPVLAARTQARARLDLVRPLDRRRRVLSAAGPGVHLRGLPVFLAAPARGGAAHRPAGADLAGG